MTTLSSCMLNAKAHLPSFHCQLVPGALYDLLFAGLTLRHHHVV